jgi:hypothetical protein
MALETGKEILDYYGRLRTEKSNFETLWQDYADNVRGRRDFISTNITPGQERMALIYDATAMQASDMLASGLHNFLTNTATQWFKVQPEDDRLLRYDEVVLWFDEVQRAMNAAFSRPEANFVPTMHEVYIDLVDFNTAGMFVEGIPGQPVFFQAIPLPELYVAESPRGRIDTVFRLHRFTNRQAVDKFGARAEGAQAKVEKEPEATREYLQLVHPRNDPARGNVSSPGVLPWRSVHVDVEKADVLEQGGYREMPFLVSRWEKEAGETYGRGPGMRALPEAKMCNKVSKTLIKGMEKAVDPPLMASDDGVILPLRTVPGGVTTVRPSVLGGDPIRPLPIQGNLPLGMQFLEMRQKNIQAAYMHDLLQIFRQPFQTATQVLEISERAMALLSPVVGRLQVEILEPMIERVFGIMVRQGRFPAPPPQLQGTVIRVEYVSPVQRSQRLSEVRSIVDTLSIIQGLAEADPTVADNLDLDEAARLIVRGNGAPASLLRSERKVREVRAANAQVAAEAQTREDVVAGAGVMKQLAEAQRGGAPLQ